VITGTKPGDHGEANNRQQEMTVQRFYFHILAGDLGMIPDTDGAELTDLRAAHQRAVRIMFHTMFSFDDLQDWRGWRVKIADAAGNLVLTVLYHSRYNKRPCGPADSKTHSANRIER
jgi:uncharacterized protein DUF6894